MSSPADDIGRRVSRRIINTYFTTQEYPYTRHHIDSYDQFMSTDLRSILRTSNPILILKDLLPNTNTYAYKVEIFVGGKDADKLRIGTPVVSLDKGEDVRLLFPNEARLRNLTYAADVIADIEVRLTFSEKSADGQVLSGEPVEITIPNVSLFRIPIMLHSRYCLLHNKPKDFLRQAGECPYDQGGYFIVDGSEKVLVTKQEQAFNTLYISKKPADPKVMTFASVTSLSPETRAVKYVAFGHMRRSEVLNISLPYVRKPVNVFILFRAMGIQSDEAIMNLIFPDKSSADFQFLADKLVPTIVDAHPFLNSYSCIQYIKTLTKGFSEVHVLDIIKNQLFIHVPDTPGARLNYLAECVRSILRVSYDFEKSTDRDDIRNQRCLTSGFSIQMLFNGIYAKWRKAVSLSVDKEWEYNKRIYSGEAFVNIFDPGNKVRIFNEGYMSDSFMRAFKGKWGSGMGEEKAGLLQSLSRLSYLDFLSHCRRVVLEFDTGMKLTGPRHLHTSQFGYFCTNETPGGASIGITKNLSILTFISTGVNPAPIVDWLRRRGGVAACNSITADQKQVFIPVTINNGIIGYTRTATELLTVLRAMKHTGYLPCTVGVGFSYTGRRLFIYTDEGRPLRPLIVNRKGFPVKAIASAESWQQLIMGTHPRRQVPLSNSEFADPLADKADVTFEDYMADLTPHLSVLEYVDPYEHNETYIATFPEHINAETTHIEVHPSTMMGLMTGMIPYANHNQSPRNQLSCSQSKQGLSIYATNWRNRYDNNGHILCYGEAPLVRTMYYDYAAEGRIGYGHNIIMALAPFEGYNQEDGIVFNRDSFQRGLFRSIAYRSYEFFEEDDEMTGAKTRIGNPVNIPGWTDLRPGLDFKHLDDRGIIRVGQYVDEDTVICGGYMMPEKGKYKDASLTPQVWTRGIVESVVITINNKGLRLVKIRVSQDRMPELGDKFCLTPEHEVLTTNGWKGIADVAFDDKVCALGNDNKIEYVNPSGVYSFNCEDVELYKVESQQMALITTLNHKMYVKKRNSKIHELIEAKEIVGKRVQYKKNAINMNNDYIFTLESNTHHSAHNAQLDMDAFLEFLGYWVSDGWISEIKHKRANNDVSIENRTELSLGKHSDMEHVTQLIQKMGYNSHANKEYNKIFIHNEQLAKYLKTYSKGAANKSLPDWIWNLSERQCKILLKGLIGGDGHIQTNGVERFFTTSTILADQFQRLCLHSGWSANKSKLGTAGTKIVICGKQTQLNADYWGLTINKHKNEPMINHGHSKTQSGQSEEIIKYTGSVHCIEVPSHIFYVRLNGKCVWTGNSNRHGQKGTIGMMFPAVDMPRTASGIVPDVIVNPHSIPSRMTIAQVLEQLFGKAAATHGAIGDATSFMNEGSPADVIGNVLEEQYGMERYGNEILYDGKTGTQIPTEMFIAPVYYMRLKHMVEDKWQARTTGRKELRTHQPTGGRGKEGGLRFGELERDAVITHGISGFVRESIMKRSDGTTFPICTGCGTVPIYNERLEIAVCPMCQGPLKFAGNTVDTLEMIPPLTKPVAPIVKIEIPYATKLLDQELTTFMNAGFRYQTTGGGLQHLNVKADMTATAPVELTERIIQETEMPDYEVRPSEVQKAAEDQSSLQNLSVVAKKLGMTLVPMEAAMRLNTIKEEATPATTAPPEEGGLDDLEVTTTGLPPTLPGLNENQVLGPSVPLTVLGSKAPQNAPPQVVQTAVMAPTTVMQPQIVPGMPVMTQQAVVNAAAGPTVIVDTSPRALQSEGIILEDVGAGGMNAGLRLASRRPSRRVNFGEEGAAAAPAAAPAAPPSGTITVNKLG